MNSNLQNCNEKARAFYESQGAPLLSIIAKAHGITVRDFAGIFGISKSLAHQILRQQLFPSLELGIRIARYWECTVEELFGWRVDDGGERRPLLVIDQKTGQVRKLVGKDRIDAIGLAVQGREG